MELQKRFVVIYLSVFVLSLIATINLNQYYELSPEPLNKTLATNNFTWIEIFFWIIFGAVLMYFIIKSPFSRIFVKIIELMIVFISITILGYAFMLPFFGNGSTTFGLLLGLIAMLMRMLGKYRNEIAVLSTAGVSSILGFSLSPGSALFLMVALAIYDYIAVFKTKHMQVLAKGLSKEETSFSIKEAEKVVVNGEVKEQFMELGSGDLLIPALVASSFLKVNIIYSIVVILGTFLGFFMLIITLKKYRTILPALPFLLAGILSSLTIWMFLVDNLIKV